MISVRVRSIWQGKVGIRDKYIGKALTDGEGLEITHQSGIMIIPAGEVQKRIVSKSERPFPDRFGKGWHYLFYFEWKPSVNQIRLF